MKKKLFFIFTLLLSTQLTCNNINWSFPPTTLSNTSLNSSDPRIATDASGNVVAAWVENGFIRASSKLINMSWSSPVTLSNTNASSPCLVSDPNGNAVAIWLEGTIVKAASKPFGSNWGTSTSISNSGASTPTLAVDSSGDAIAAWAQTNGNIQTATKLFGANWQGSVNITSSAGTLPSIALSGTGSNKTAVVVWNGTSGTTNVVYASSKLLSGNWSTGQIISDTTSQAGYAHVAMDIKNNATAVWYKYTLTGIDYSNVIVQSATRGGTSGTWNTPVSISSPGIVNPANLVSRIAYDANGNAVALWNTSFDGMTFNIESALKPVRQNWSNAVDIINSNLHANSVDLTVTSFGDALTLYMFYNGVSLIIQSSESDITGFLENAWSVPLNVSTGNNNGFPRTAATLTGNAINAAAIWIGVNGSHNVIEAVTGSKNLPVPPTALSVVQSSNNFAVFTEYYNTVSWTASTDPTVMGYLIYRDGTLIGQVSAGTVSFVDHNQVQSAHVTYGVASINSEPEQGAIVFVTL